MKNTVTVEFRSPITGQLIAVGTYATKRAFHRGHDRADLKYGMRTSAKVIAGDLNALPYQMEKAQTEVLK